VPKAATDGGAAAAGTGTTGKLEIVSGKATPEEIKEKMEQQLKMQRAAHQQKRALETLKMPSGQVLKVVPTTQQGELILQRHWDFKFQLQSCAALRCFGQRWTAYTFVVYNNIIL
jgi:nucleosome-remodeling factor subunit BPTF